MDDRHPSGYSPDYGAYGYDSYSTGSYQTVGTTYADGDPLFGALSSTTTTTTTAAYDGYSESFPTGSTAYYGTGGYDTGTYDTAGYDTGTYDTSANWQTGGYQIPHQQSWDSGHSDQSGQYYLYQAYGQDAYATGSYDTTSWQTTAYTPEPHSEPEYLTRPETAPGQVSAYEATYESEPAYEPEAAYESEPAYEPERAYEPEADAATGDGYDPRPADEAETETDDEPHDETVAAPVGVVRVPSPRNRRRRTAKRSALLTVAVPSVAVMGVTAVAAASVTGFAGSKDSKPQAGRAASNVTTQLDRQLAGLTADADDFANRASRTQERLDLKDRQAAERKRKADEAARKEALRPKFLLPVEERGLSAYFGQAGVNWMALHTGIDFPVPTGTPVMAATDGTIRTQWNSAYGNMAIVTAPDGTETWYCHLSSTKIRSGEVKAGEVIAYSGNTGNTTGPHLHFEVRPGGGSPIDPLPWLLAHGLDPR